jgi:hypothetical protein
VTVKTSIAAAAFALLGVVAPQSSHAADSRCLRNFGDPPGKGCVSAPLEYCLRGIAVGGGVCARDRSYLDQSDDRDSRQRRARRSGRERWDW